MKSVIGKGLFVKVAVCLFVLMITGVNFYQNRINVDADPTFPGDDTSSYYFLATQIKENHIYSEGWPDPPFRAWRPPVYPALLAVLLWTSNDNLLFLVFFQYTLLLLSGLLIWYLYDLLYDSFYGGLVSCVLILFYSPFYYYSSYLFSEIPFIFFTLLFIVVVYQSYVSRSFLGFAISGIIFACSILLRTVNLPIFYLATIFLIFVLFIRQVEKYQFQIIIRLSNLKIRLIPPILRIWNLLNRLRTKDILIFLGCAWFVVGIWTVRNYLVLDEFVMINTANGMNFYLGTEVDFYHYQTAWNGELWRVSGEKWVRVHEEVIHPLRSELGEVGASKALSRLAINEILQNPFIYLRHKIQTNYRYFFPSLDDKFHIVEGFFDYGTIQPFIYTVFFLNIIMMLVQKNSREISLFLFFLLMVFSSSLSFFSERFVVVVMPFYFMFAVAGLFKLASAFRHFLINRDVLMHKVKKVDS